MDVPSDSANIDREKGIDYLESQFPALFEAAVRVAYWNTLAAGHSVLESENGFIYETFPDGSRKVVKQIEPPINVDMSQRITIQ